MGMRDMHCKKCGNAHHECECAEQAAPSRTLGQIAYEAVAAVNETHEGLPAMPWEMLSTEEIEAWEAGAMAVVHAVVRVASKGLT